MRTSKRNFGLGCALALSLVSLVGACDKGGAGTRAPSADDSGPIEMNQETAARVIVEAFQKGRIDRIQSIAVSPLSEDLTQPFFDEIAEVIQWLGPVSDYVHEESEAGAAASQHLYTVEFEKGTVELEVTLLGEGELLGFHFQGPDFIAAEHGALKDGYTNFKVYDLKFTNEFGKPNPTGNHITGGRVDFRIIVGGLEADLGEHHLSIEKLVYDQNGKMILDEPIEYDLRFEENAEGVPRGAAQMFLVLEAPAPGEYELDLKIKDNHAEQELLYKQKFIIDK